MFLGEYQHTIDDKGRLVMPSKFRHHLAEGVVVTKGHERCVYVYPHDRWQDELDRMSRFSIDNREHRTYLRVVFGSASDQSIDRQGRVALPPALRAYAGLDQRVTVVGVADHLEIWDAAKWEAISEAADTAYADLEEALTEEGS